MKTYTLICIFLTGVYFCNAQQNTSETRNVSFTADVVVQNKNTDNQQHPRIAAAFNGWLYAAYTINDTSTKRGGIYVSISKDNGQSWKKLVTYEFTNSFYRYTDIAVAGSDTSHLSVFLAGTLLNLSSGNSTVYMDKFDGTDGNLISGQVYVRNLGLLNITDMAIFSDSQYPSPVSSPYSVSILYAIHGGIQDSLIFAVSSDGGQTFPTQNVVAHTSGAFRKIALGYGKSPSVSSGAYFASWELLNSHSSTLGHIYVSHTKLTINAGWNTPVCLDSLSSGTVGICRNPTIACQLGSVNNDVADLSVVVAFERASGGNMQNMDLVGCYNKKSFTATTWLPFVLAGTPENDIQPFLSYNSASNRFLITYFDSTDGKLPYAVQDMNLANITSWNYLSTQYNDQTNNLFSPHPVIAVNPLLQEACFLWKANSPNNGNGIIYFDAEYAGLATVVSSVSLPENKIGHPYPNPAVENLNIPVTLQLPHKMHSEIYDILGNVVMRQEDTPLTSGMQNMSFDISSLENGVYFCHLQTDGLERTLRFTVQH